MTLFGARRRRGRSEEDTIRTLLRRWNGGADPLEVSFQDEDGMGSASIPSRPDRALCPNCKTLSQVVKVIVDEDDVRRELITCVACGTVSRSFGGEALKQHEEDCEDCNETAA